MALTHEESIAFSDHFEQYVREAAAFIKANIPDQKHEFGVVLGSGLGDLADAIEGSVKIPYKDIPHFPKTTVQGHEGVLIAGTLQGVPVIGLKGRKHFYEDAFNRVPHCAVLQPTFAVHTLAEMGVPNYFVTNAAGGLNQKYDIADIMIIQSHISLLPNPLQGRELDLKRLDGTPTWFFQPMAKKHKDGKVEGEYHPGLRAILREAGKAYPGTMREGFYMAVTGKSYETQAECLAFRKNVDAVGMSTTQEVIVAKHRGMNCVGFSCITNKIDADGNNATNHEEVVAVLNDPKTRARLCGVVKNFFELYDRGGRVVELP